MPLGEVETRIADGLAKLSGIDFQEEVSRLLARNIPSFQAMPETREGGIDGLSHNQEVAYCCLGLKESTIRGSTLQGLSDSICDKFQKDLRKLFELKQERSSGNLAHAPNVLLGKVRRGQRRIRCMRLIVNHFEDPSIVGRLQAARDRYSQASKNTHIDPDCSVVIEGPTQLVLRLGVGPVDLYHIEARGISALFAMSFSREGHEDELDRFKLDEKMDALAAANPRRVDGVEALRSQYYGDWVDYLGMMTRLDADHPSIYEYMLELEHGASSEAHKCSMGTSPQDMPQMIDRLGTSIQEMLEKDPPVTLPPWGVKKYVQRLTAYLVSDCALDWRPQDAN